MVIKASLMRLPVTSALIGVVTLAALSSGRVAAADLDYGYGSAPSVAALPESKVEFGSGWYVRGDIGVTVMPKVYANDETYNTSTIANVVTSGGGGCSQTSAAPNCYYNNAYQYNSSVFSGPGTNTPDIAISGSHELGYDASLGAGYQINRWFRTDATFDFLKPMQSSYNGRSLPCITGTSPLPVSQGQTPTSENILSASCTPTLNASLKSYAALINGYVDLGHYWRVTPYIGAGAGLSFGYASASARYYQNNTVAYQISYTDAIAATSFYQNWNRSKSVQYYNLAFAVMGGIAIDVYDHTKLDIGYRYLNLGQVLGSNLAVQEARVGLRYMVDN